jgi:hypothetical protein
MINKKIAAAVAGGVLCLICIGGFAMRAHSTKPTSVEPLKRAAQEGSELIDELTDTVDMTKTLENRESFSPLEIKYAFVDSTGCARVIVDNITQTPITSYELELVYFSEKGAPLEEHGTYTVQCNLPAGGEVGLNKYVGGNGGGKYITPVIKSVTYGDGTGWVNDNAALELAVKATSFDIPAFEQTMQKDGDKVQMAAQNPYLKINNMTEASTDEISGRHDLKLVVTNTSDKTITGVEVAVAELDRDNKAVDASPQSYVSKNVRLATCKDIALTKGESKSLASTSFLETDCYRINAVVTAVEFSDGTRWDNPYALNWLMWFS